MPAPATTPKPKPRRQSPARRERPKPRPVAERRERTKPERRASTISRTAIPASLSPPRIAIKRGTTLATAEARLAAIALLVAAAGSLALLTYLRRGELE